MQPFQSTSPSRLDQGFGRAHRGFKQQYEGREHIGIAVVQEGPAKPPPLHIAEHALTPIVDFGHFQALADSRQAQTSTIPVVRN